MCKEMPVILVDRVVEKKRIIRKKWRAKEEERYKVSLPPPQKNEQSYHYAAGKYHQEFTYNCVHTYNAHWSLVFDTFVKIS
jgi:hypothetical protein